MIENVLRNIIEISLFASIMIGACLLIRFLAGGRVKQRYLMMLWAVILLRLIVPFTIESPVSIADAFQPEIMSQAETDTAINDLSFMENFLGNTVNQSNIERPVQIENVTNTTIQESNSTQVVNTSLFQKVLKAIKSINIWIYLFAIYLIGALVLFVYFVIHYIKFNHLIQMGEITKEKKTISLLNKQKRLLGVKRNVVLIKSDFIDKPITFRLFNPCIVIPYDMEIEYRKLDLILFHEMCHIKRKDLTVNLLWLFAKTIHWFNPFVWIAYKNYLDDMELACDELVVRHLNKKQSLLYSQSLIDVVRQTKNSFKLQVGLSFIEDKSKLRKRVENMLKPKKKLKSIGVLVIAVIGVMLVGGFTTACQPTQDEEESKLIESDSDNKPIGNKVHNEFPASWEEGFSIDNGRINVEINTSVSVPNTDSYAIIQAKPIAFEQNQIDKFRKYFIGDATLISEPKEVKSDFDEAIADMEKGIKDLDETSPQEKEMIESMRGIIEEYKRQRELAPETDEPHEITDFTLTDERIVGDFSLDNGLSGWAELSKDRFTYFTSRAGLQKSYYFGDNLSVTDNRKIAEQEAIEIVENTLDDLGIDGFEFDSIEDSYIDIDYSNSTATCGYYIKFMHGYNSIVPVFAPYFGESIHGQVNLNDPKVERIEIYLDGDGEVTGFNWQNPYDVSEIIEDNLQLLGFSKIQQIFKDEIEQYWSLNKDNDSDLTVNYLSLNYVYERSDNSSSEIQLIPCWYMRVKQKDNGDLPDDRYYMIQINAVTGEIMTCLTI